LVGNATSEFSEKGFFGAPALPLFLALPRKFNHAPLFLVKHWCSLIGLKAAAQGNFGVAFQNAGQGVDSGILSPLAAVPQWDIYIRFAFTTYVPNDARLISRNFAFVVLSPTVPTATPPSHILTSAAQSGIDGPAFKPDPNAKIFDMRPKAWHVFMILGNFLLAIRSKLHSSLLSKLLDFNGTHSLGLFTSASVALISHKVILIRLHEPLSAWRLILASPFLFIFDFLNLVVLYLSFQSPHLSKRILATLFACFILLLSTASASFYMETNAEMNWRRTATVLPQIIWN